MHAASGPLLLTYALTPGTPVNPPPPFAAASRLTMGQGQSAETCDQPLVVRPPRSKPYFMTEFEGGSGVYFKAYVTSETLVEIKLKFPGTHATSIVRDKTHPARTWLIMRQKALLCLCFDRDLVLLLCIMVT